MVTSRAAWKTTEGLCVKLLADREIQTLELTREQKRVGLLSALKRLIGAAK
jgi:hypothetical protein